MALTGQEVLGSATEDVALSGTTPVAIFSDSNTGDTAAGFTAVEYLFPYAFPAEVLAERLRDFGLTQVLHNLPAGNWDAGERGIANQPRRHYQECRPERQRVAWADPV